MKKIIVAIFVFFFLFGLRIGSENLESELKLIWKKSYPEAIIFRSVQPVANGYVLAGEKFTPRRNTDVYVMKIDLNGKKIWERVYGGVGLDGAYYITSTNDGGFLVVGYKMVREIYFNRSCSEGDTDTYLIKLDSKGNRVWEKTYRNHIEGREMGYFITETKNGYILGGKIITSSFARTFVLKLDKNGKTIDYLPINESNHKVEKCVFKKFGSKIMLLDTKENYEGEWPDDDLFLISLGEEWIEGGWIEDLKNFTNIDTDDRPEDFIRIADGYVIVSTFFPSWRSESGIYTAPSGHIWDEEEFSWRSRILKVDFERNKIWEREYGKEEFDSFGLLDAVFFKLIKPIKDGFLIAGEIGYKDQTTKNDFPDFDIILVKLNQKGEIVWKKVFRYDSQETVCDFQKTMDGGYILVGGNQNEGLVIKVGYK